MILGTAGHIDHGKTALVRALTGVDTDRLPEEKRRGITIELGFAPLRLANGDVLGVVDVPGHEAFVRTMLAGASGIDVALLVIAADEGPMPQTREHLAILELLEVQRAVVALTKADLVDADWLALVTEEVRELLKDTSFASAKIIPTSVTNRTGLDELREAIGQLAESREPNRRGAAAENDVFRLPVDRAFSVKGTGTVVTGTVWSGTLGVEDTVRLMPSGELARVRGIQSHGASVSRASPGMRAAIAVAGVEPVVVARGASLVTRSDWNATLVVRADLTLLADAPTLRPRTSVRFHLGTSDVGGRVIAVGGPVGANSLRPVRIVLDEPVLARAGDRFVLRSASPLTTIGGGVITDPNATRRTKPMAQVAMTESERLALFVTEAGLHGVLEATLPVRLGVSPLKTKDVVASARGITRVGERLLASAALDGAKTRLRDLVTSHHANRPLDAGAPREEMRSRLGVDVAIFDQLVDSLVRAKHLETSGAELRAAGRSTDLAPPQRKLADDMLAVLDAAGYEPPSVSELQTRFGPQTVPLLRHLERNQRVVQVEDSRFYTPHAVRELLRRLEAGMAGKGELAPTDLREVLGFSRKYLIPFLEFCDKKGYTARHGNGRVWRGGPEAKART
jgi:selenocysteine-specific elongation factor